MATVKLHVFKENFKFSAAHFMIFASGEAERLHGHNYAVKIVISSQLDSHMTSQSGQVGYAIDFREIKSRVRAQLEKWDERTLLPARSPHLKIFEGAKNFEVHFSERFYSFPKEDVCLLPISNSSVEELCRLLGEILLLDLKNLGAESFEISVSESPGQWASMEFR